MILFNSLILLLCAIKSNQDQWYRWHEKYSSLHNSYMVPIRLLEIMRSYYEETNIRIATLNDQRFMYEESPYYEEGYIMGEIIESYRKLVEHVKRPLEYASDSVFETLKRVERVQKSYFEIYHLVRMMHETPRKWKFDEDVPINETIGTVGKTKAEEYLEAVRQIRERERKVRKRQEKKYRNMYMKGESPSMHGNKSEYNRWWPIDYGWEIDYWW